MKHAVLVERRLPGSALGREVEKDGFASACFKGNRCAPNSGRLQHYTMRRLLTVEDTFTIADRDLLVIAPAPGIHEVRGPGEVPAELRLPDGKVTTAMLTISYVFVTPPPDVRRWACSFKSLGRNAVPIGTEIWCEDDLFLTP